MIGLGMDIPSQLEVSLGFGDVRGKVALLSGDVQEGAILAVELVKHGCRVVLAGSPLTRVAEACNKILNTENVANSFKRLASINDADFVRAIELDAARGEQAVEQATEKAWRAFGGINILLSCPSRSGTPKPVLEMRENDYDDIMDASLKASWLVSIAVARKMCEAKTGGSIVFLTSISGTERGIYPGTSLQGTSMAAINHLTKMMAMELGKYEIRVNAIACGLTESDALLQTTEKESAQELAKRAVPMQRWSKFPDDILGVILWLAGDFSTFVTGTITIVDGGVSIRRPRLGEYRSKL